MKTIKVKQRLFVWISFHFRCRSQLLLGFFFVLNKCYAIFLIVRRICYSLAFRSYKFEQIFSWMLRRDKSCRLQTQWQNANYINFAHFMTPPAAAAAEATRPHLCSAHISLFAYLLPLSVMSPQRVWLSCCLFDILLMIWRHDKWNAPHVSHFELNSISSKQEKAVNALGSIYIAINGVRDTFHSFFLYTLYCVVYQL